MFGPFQDNVLKCLIAHGKFTACILQELDWFDVKSGKLNRTAILDSVYLHVKNQNLFDRVNDLVEECVTTANSQNADQNGIGEEFVMCLDGKNAFADLFPKVFCKRKDGDQPIEKHIPEDTSAPALRKQILECVFASMNNMSNISCASTSEMLFSNR
ncbi:uncharacterized protein [Fopius arisanus]|uniref:Uncharacterized protein n=1 Tax=Fopius arisanus TaxID=64838 RepID=A0A9R1TJV5_9HYME|nr:PREDICTED: uncharacterized protein LOC105270949 [Fopius arisanus]